MKLSPKDIVSLNYACRTLDLTFLSPGMAYKDDIMNAHRLKLRHGLEALHKIMRGARVDTQSITLDHYEALLKHAREHGDSKMEQTIGIAIGTKDGDKEAKIKELVEEWNRRYCDF